MQRSLFFLVATSALSTYRASWILGNLGESCYMACGKMGMECHKEDMAAHASEFRGSDDDIRAKYESFGQVCQTVYNRDSFCDYQPFAEPRSGVCYHAWCSGNCDVKSDRFKRACYCRTPTFAPTGPTPAPTPLPAGVTHAPTSNPTAPTPAPPCQDIVPPGQTQWNNPSGSLYNCAEYEASYLCQRYGGDAFSNFGYSANQACCVCGGGTTLTPTRAPTQAPTVAPTMAPTMAPTIAPTTASPTQAPTTIAPTAPTQRPTLLPTQALTLAPTQAPTQAPTPPPTLGAVHCSKHQWYDSNEIPLGKNPCKDCSPGQQASDDKSHCEDETSGGLTEIQWVAIGGGMTALTAGASAACFIYTRFYRAGASEGATEGAEETAPAERNSV